MIAPSPVPILVTPADSRWVVSLPWLMLLFHLLPRTLARPGAPGHSDAGALSLRYWHYYLRHRELPWFVYIIRTAVLPVRAHRCRTSSYSLFLVDQRS
uniref:Putative secreted peptide n=1 Tax=Anopheles braziliensis TaxID=58242 RepID=A0A2M3ZU63_9DIPT